MAVTDAPATESVAPNAGERRWRLIRRWSAAGYFAGLVAFCVLVGIPTSREDLLIVILLGLAVRCLGRGWRSYGRVLLDWLPFTAVLLIYDYTRGIADTVGAATHVRAPLDADLWLFHGTLPTYWLQQHFYIPGDTRWYDAIETLVYTSHFLATPIAAVILWVRNRERWLSFISRVIALSFAGLATYVFYPAAPPWYAAKEGLADPVVRISSRGWAELGLSHVGSLLAGAQASVNAVAAMPSLHTASATLIALFFIPRARWWLKIPLACYPLLMGLALVYSAEHYVVDLLFGYVYGVAVTLVAVWLERRLAARGVGRGAGTAQELATTR